MPREHGIYPNSVGAGDRDGEIGDFDGGKRKELMGRSGRKEEVSGLRRLFMRGRLPSEAKDETFLNMD